jgi:hypothetical protein
MPRIKARGSFIQYKLSSIKPASYDEVSAILQEGPAGPLAEEPAYKAIQDNLQCKKYTVGRKDNNLGYILGNVEWQTRLQQANDLRTNRRMMYKGENKLVRDICKEVGLGLTTFYQRLHRGLTGNDLIAPPKNSTGRRVK